MSINTNLLAGPVGKRVQVVTSMLPTGDLAKTCLDESMSKRSTVKRSIVKIKWVILLTK